MDEEFIARLEQKADYHAREAERYRTTAEVLRSELPGGRSARTNRGAAGGSTGRSNDPSLNTAAMLEAALNEAYKPMHPSELVGEMRRLGWQSEVRNSVNTVRTAAHRLADQGRIQRLPNGLYARLGMDVERHESAAPTGPDPDEETANGDLKLIDDSEHRAAV